MEVPRLRVRSELQLLAYTTARAMQDPSYICDLHHSSRPCWILNPLSGTGDGTCILMNPSQIHYHLCHDGNSKFQEFWQIPEKGPLPFYQLGKNITCQNLWDAVKAEKCSTLNVLEKKKDLKSVNNLSLHPRKLGKDEKMKSKEGK